MTTLRVFLIHLRLPFQLALAPFFLLGAAAGAAPPTARLVVAFVAVHVGLYGGATVYNSYFDRDDGPIGMLWRPPAVPRVLHPASLLLQLAAALVLAWGAWPAGLVALLMVLMGIGYSRPWPRLKGRTAEGLLLVALGQGLFAVMLGYFAASPPGPPPSAVWLSGTAASVLVAGIYPLTQIYQVDDDRRRGDRTLAVRYGWRFAMAFSGVTTLLALLAIAYAVLRPLTAHWLAIGGGAVAGFGGCIALWWPRFEALGTRGNFRVAMALLTTVSGVATAALVVQLAMRLGG